MVGGYTIGKQSEDSAVDAYDEMVGVHYRQTVRGFQRWMRAVAVGASPPPPPRALHAWAWSGSVGLPSSCPPWKLCLPGLGFKFRI